MFKRIFKSEGLTQYEKPTGNHQYVITADVARGKGLDFSTFTVFDVTTYFILQYL